MPYRAITIALSLCISAVSLFLRCTGNPTFAGGVETTNGLTVVASGKTIHGRAPIGSTVSLFSQYYNPTLPGGGLDESRDSVSIDEGLTYSFAVPRDSSTYNIIAISATADSGAVASSLLVQAGRRDSLYIPFNRLGEISGSAIRVNNSDTTAISFHNIYLEGSNLFTQSDSLGYYKISNIPLGQFTVKLVLEGPVIVSTGPPTSHYALLGQQDTTVIVNFIIKE